MLRLILALFIVVSPVAQAAPNRIIIDPATTQITFQLKATGHTVHGVAPILPVELAIDQKERQITGKIVFETKAITTNDKGRDKNMHKNVIESEKFPDINFTPQGWSGDLTDSGKSTITLTGEMLIHGDTHTLEIPLAVEMFADHLQASGDFVLPYVAWGMKDPSFLFLRVAKAAQMHLELTAQFGK